MRSLNIQQSKNILYVVLVFLIAWLLGQMIWKGVYSPEYELPMPEIGQSAAPESVSRNFAPVYLFGKSAIKTDEPVIGDAEDVKKTRLNLKLLGVLVAPNLSIAILEKSGKSDSYAPEEEIQRGVVLKKVYEDYVVISNHGLLEKIEMAKVENLFDGEMTDATVPLSAQQKATIQDVKQKVLSNPVAIMRYVRFQNVMSDGKLQSVKVWPRQEKEIFDALGFKPGDELLQVDGEPVEGLAQSPEKWQELLNKSMLDLIVKRNGQEMSLSVELQ